MITPDDAVTNAQMRAVIRLRRPVNLTLAALGPDYVGLVSGGFVMVGNQLRFESEAKRLGPNEVGRDPRVSESQEEWEENDVFIRSGLRFDDPAWRVQIMLTALDIVQKMLPQAAAIARYPVQAIIFLNPDPDEPGDEEDELACGGVKFHQLHPSDPMDQRLDLGVNQPAAVFTMEANRAGAN